DRGHVYPSSPMVEVLMHRTALWSGIMPKGGEVSDKCFIWEGEVHPAGYGSYEGRAVHRISFEIFVGPIPPDCELRHLCNNLTCVRPSHLEMLTDATSVPQESAMVFDRYEEGSR